MQYFISPYNEKVETKFPENLLIYDTTLRDGEQTPGVCFTIDEKIEIAQKLDQLGIHQIEAGFPIVSKDEEEAVAKIKQEGLNAEIIALTRVKTADIDAALKCDVDGIITFMGTSPLHMKYKMDMTKEEAKIVSMNAVEYAKDHGLYVAFSAEDATRADINYLKELYSLAESYKADRIHIADTVGCITPQGITYLVKELRKTLNIDIGLHCHNDFGLAVANSIAGLLAGGNAVSTTVNGIGERAGNASLEELIMAIKLLYGHEIGFNTEYIQELSDLVSKYSDLEVPYNKAVVGKNIFRHESGIHVDAVIEEPLTYEPYLPEIVGQKRKLVLGKHSGFRAVEAKLKECNMEFSNDDIRKIVKDIKKVREEGTYITDDVFFKIVKDSKDNGI